MFFYAKTWDCDFHHSEEDTATHDMTVYDYVRYSVANCQSNKDGRYTTWTQPVDHLKQHIIHVLSLLQKINMLF